MPDVTSTEPGGAARRRSLQILICYVIVAVAGSAWRVAGGTGSWIAVAGYLLLLAVAVVAPRRPGATASFMADWLPLLALPGLYAAVPATIFRADGATHDTVIQRMDHLLFGTDPARTLAGAMPYTAVSELLHGAYLSYYLIIYAVPLVLRLRRQWQGFAEAVLASTIAMTFCFVVFCLFPVAGPRYEWSAPEGVPEGVFRTAAVMVLEGGSSRGTAFPSSHVAIALSLGLSSLRWAPRLAVLLLTLSVLLGAGAVYGGFHYVTDVGVGAAVGVAAWAMARRVETGKAALG